MVVLCCIVVVTGFLPSPVSRSSLSSPPSQVIDPTSYDRPCWAFKALSSIRNSPFLWDGNKNTMLSFPAAERRVSLIVLKLRLGW